LRLGRHGGDRKSAEYKDQADNISLKRGTSATYAEVRLHRDHPAIYEEVRSGKISANAGIDADVANAIIEAGPDELLGQVKERALAKHGTNQHTRNEDLTLSSPDPASGKFGTSRTYAEARLHRDHPAIYEEVRSGKISANARMIKAGIRKKQTALTCCRLGRSCHQWFAAVKFESATREDYRNDS
jgi:hypothetical protein